MTGKEFIARVQRYGKQHDLTVTLDQKRGKGSHVTLSLGDAFTVVRNPKDELRKGTLAAMCRQLGIDRNDL